MIRQVLTIVALLFLLVTALLVYGCTRTHEDIPAHTEDVQDTATVLYQSDWTGNVVRKFCDEGDGITRYVVYIANNGEGIAIAVRPALHTEC